MYHALSGRHKARGVVSVGTALIFHCGGYGSAKGRALRGQNREVVVKAADRAAFMSDGGMSLTVSSK